MIRTAEQVYEISEQEGMKADVCIFCLSVTTFSWAGAQGQQKSKEVSDSVAIIQWPC
jgi:hypothetical protein